ncbi:hypothetical protein WDU94_006839 [Cyamophila willieti]
MMVKGPYQESYRKYQYYFDIYHEFKRIYYSFLNKFYERIFSRLKRELVAKFRLKRDKVSPNTKDFLDNEYRIDARFNKIVSNVDLIVSGHYCQIDDVATKSFFKNFRYHYDEKLYKNLREEFDYHLGHPFFKSSGKSP